jgi:hypothetical protein
MVDFAQKLKELRDSRTPEEKEHWARYEKLVKENTFYETETITTADYKCFEIAREVKLYKRVDFHSLNVSAEVTLSLGGSPYEYEWFRFYKIWSESSDKSICTDNGNGICVTASEAERVIAECISTLSKQGLVSLEETNER